MKRFLVFLIGLLFVSSTIKAQKVQWFKATEIAIKLRGEDWSDWERVSIKIKFDLTNDFITIYSKETQIYQLIETLDPPYDPDGEQVKFEVMDQDFDIGHLRLRLTDSGDSQIYIDFSDISWVYNIIRIR